MVRKRKGRSSEETPPKGIQKQLKMSDFLDTSSQAEVTSMDSESHDQVFTSPIGQSDMVKQTVEAESAQAKTNAFMLTTQESQIIQEIYMKLDSLAVIKSEVIDLKKTIQELIDSVRFSETELKESRETIAKLKQDIENMKEQIEVQKVQSRMLNEKMIDQENYSRRENILICGVNENRNENIFRLFKNCSTFLVAIM